MSPWKPPTEAGLVRWRKLLEAARASASNEPYSDLALERALEAVTRDTYPSRRREDWAAFDEWIRACREITKAPGQFGGGSLTRLTLDDATEAVAEILGQARRLIDRPASPPPTLPFRRDIDG